MSLNDLAPMLGSYKGKGIWRDDAGGTRRYTIDMSLSLSESGELRQSFRHLFYEEDDAVIEQDLTFTPKADSILAFDLPGTGIAGRGYYSPRLLHYTIPLPGNNVEVTYFFTPDGTATIAGSSEKNADGNYIMWEEHLSRTGDV